jgi:hypothetical protein
VTEAALIRANGTAGAPTGVVAAAQGAAAPAAPVGGGEGGAKLWHEQEPKTHEIRQKVTEALLTTNQRTRTGVVPAGAAPGAPGAAAPVAPAGGAGACAAGAPVAPGAGFACTFCHLAYVNAHSMLADVQNVPISLYWIARLGPSTKCMQFC